MKSISIFSLLICLSMGLLAQRQDPIKHFYKKYRHVDDATHLNIGGILLDIATTFADEEDHKQLMARINRLRVLSIPGHNTVAGEDLISLRQSVLGNGFEELIMVRDEGSLVNVYLLEDANEVIEQIFILVEEPDEITLVNLMGKLHYDDLQHLDLGGNGGAALQQAAIP